MVMEYTKGEWIAEDNKITVYQRGIIALCPRPNHEGVFEFQANANLIAASPDMYEACLLFLRERSMNDPAYQAIIEALAKAEGGK
ncbi:MAG TPA: hypothetical protein VMW50_10260 [Dehalococcoidia bacterium]|nr:hypothetical protein [Dehalococcoidia bacterium]